MYREEDLKKRPWPQRQEVKDHRKFLAYSRLTPFVRQGHVLSRELRLPQALSRPIPPGECAITSLCLGPGGRIYGATSGTRSHLFYYDPGPGADGVCDIGVIDGATAVRGALVATCDGFIYGGVSDGSREGILFRYATDADVMGEGGTGCGTVEYLSAPLPGEQITGLVVDGVRGVLYGVGQKSGTLFSYELTGGRVERKGRLDENGYFSGTLVMDGEGNVFGCGAYGRLARYDRMADRLDMLDTGIPSVAGRSLYNRLESAVWNAFDGLIYGAGSADGVVFSCNPRNGSVCTIGKATAASGCSGMAAGADGRIYGLSGTKDGMAHLFQYDPVSRSLDDLGILYSGSEAHWHGYEFGAMCTGAYGEIYCGESDRISHLFIYFPPILPRLQPTG